MDCRMGKTNAQSIGVVLDVPEAGPRPVMMSADPFDQRCLYAALASDQSEDRVLHLCGIDRK